MFRRLKRSRKAFVAEVRVMDVDPQHEQKKEDSNHLNKSEGINTRLKRMTEEDACFAAPSGLRCV